MEAINLHLGDCLEAMRSMPDKAYDLAIVDPPYGIGANKMTLGNGKRKVFRGTTDWDSSTPSKEYWNELFRVSFNQIVWGANYMTEYLPPSMGWIFWDKGTGLNDFSDGELAYTSFKRALRMYKISWVGANAKERNELDRIHPTQKPVKLYEWLLDNYAKEGDRILDTHLGSGSIAIACHNRGFSLDAWEIDAEYFEAANKRFNEHKAQLTIWNP